MKPCFCDTGVMRDNYSASDWPELASDWPIMGTVTWVRGQGRCELSGGNFTALLVYCPSRQGREHWAVIAGQEACSHALGQTVSKSPPLGQESNSNPLSGSYISIVSEPTWKFFQQQLLTQLVASSHSECGGGHLTRFHFRKYFLRFCVSPKL